jgi:hypothetical protein
MVVNFCRKERQAYEDTKGRVAQETEKAMQEDSYHGDSGLV